MITSGINRLLLKGVYIFSTTILIYVTFQLFVSYYTNRAVNENLKNNETERVFWEINNNISEIESIFLNHNLGYIPSLNRVYVISSLNRDYFNELAREEIGNSPLFKKLVKVTGDIENRIREYSKGDPESSEVQIVIKDINELFFVSRLLSGKINNLLKDNYIKDSSETQDVIYANLISIVLLFFSSFIIIFYIFIIKRYVMSRIEFLNRSISSIEDIETSKKLSYENNDEFKSIFSTVNRLLEKIKDQHNYLRESKERFKTLFNNHPDALIMFDKSVVPVDCNKAAYNLFEVTNLNQLSDHIKRVFNPKKLSQIVQMLNYSFIEMKLKKYSDEEFLADLITSITEIEGDTFYLITIRDITESRKAEERELQVQKMETIGTLAGGIAHDFNNVLSGIIGTLSILKFKMSKDVLTKDGLENYLDTIDRSAERAKGMVSGLLNLSRSQPLNFEPVDLNSIIEHVINIAQNSFDKSVVIQFKPSSQSKNIYADSAKLEQVILNMMINASHAMTIMRARDHKWGGRLSVEVAEVRRGDIKNRDDIDLNDSNYYLLKMSDEGIGMDDELISKIFTPFFTTKDKGEGTGLGLSMAYNIISQHNGFIDILSTIGKGSTFMIYLPTFNSDEVVDSATLEQEIKNSNDGGKIVVVDDEEIMRRMGSEILKEFNYEVFTAENGQKGLDIVTQHGGDIDLVILDMVMPVLSGKETFYQLKESYPNIKILMSSGFKDDIRMQEVLNSGADGFIQKPYTVSNLINKVSSILEDQHS